MNSAIGVPKNGVRGPALAVMAIVVGVAAAAAGGVQGANFRLEFLPPAGAEETAVRDFLNDSRLLNEIALAVASRIDLPVTVTVEVGRTDPHYDVATRTISIPYALEPLPDLGDPTYDPLKRGSLFEGIIPFVACHEIGHSLIDILLLQPDDLTEEEMADSIGIYLVSELLGRADLVSRALAETALVEGAPAIGRKGWISQDRYRQLACWLDGAVSRASRPAGWEGRGDGLDGECCRRYGELVGRVERLFEPHLKSR